MARKTNDYKLRLRCVDSGRIELFASFPSKDVVNQGELNEIGTPPPVEHTTQPTEIIRQNLNP